MGDAVADMGSELLQGGFWLDVDDLAGLPDCDGPWESHSPDVDEEVLFMAVHADDSQHVLEPARRTLWQGHRAMQLVFHGPARQETAEAPAVGNEVTSWDGSGQESALGVDGAL